MFNGFYLNQCNFIVSGATVLQAIWFMLHNISCKSGKLDITVVFISQFKYDDVDKITVVKGQGHLSSMHFELFYQVTSKVGKFFHVTRYFK